LKEIDCGMFQPKEKPKYLVYFYNHQLGKILILDEVVDVIVKDKKIGGWIVTNEE
jgi:hypothetical protein